MNQTNSMRVRSSAEYVIEVNDKGDTIRLDPTDTTLSLRFVKMVEEIDALTEKYTERVKEIDKRPDEPLNPHITKNQYDSGVLMDEYYVDAQNAIDSVLGDGACQKIFGGRRWVMMFQDLADQLSPHMEKMGINARKIREDVVKKYMPESATGRVLK